MNGGVFSDRVPAPITTEPTCSGIRRCCGKPPITAPSKMWFSGPSFAPCLMITWLSRMQPSLIVTSRSTIEKGPMTTSRPMLAVGSTTARGWICTVKHLEQKLARLPWRRMSRETLARALRGGRLRLVLVRERAFHPELVYRPASRANSASCTGGAGFFARRQNATRRPKCRSFHSFPGFSVPCAKYRARPSSSPPYRNFGTWNETLGNAPVLGRRVDIAHRDLPVGNAHPAGT